MGFGDVSGWFRIRFLFIYFPTDHDVRGPIINLVCPIRTVLHWVAIFDPDTWLVDSPKAAHCKHRNKVSKIWRIFISNSFLCYIEYFFIVSFFLLFTYLFIFFQVANTYPKLRGIRSLFYNVMSSTLLFSKVKLKR